MMKIALAAAAVFTLGTSSAFAIQGAHSPYETGSVPASNAIKRIWYYAQDPEQYAHPPRYTGPPPVSHPNKVWYYSEDPEQYAHPPRYTGPPPVSHPNKVWYYSEDPEQYAHPAY